MSTTILYKNIMGETLTSQQFTAIQDYHMKEFYDESGLKKVEHYTPERKINDLEYYLGAEEDLATTVLNNIETYGNGTFYYNKQITSGYTSWDMNSYNGSNLIANGKVVYDNKFRKIAYQFIDILNNQSPKVVKKFYLEDLGDYAGDDDVIDNGTFEFHYNFPDLEIGDIYVNVNLAPFVDSGGYIIDSDENILTHPLIIPLFSWNDHPYYHGSDPLVPITIV